MNNLVHPLRIGVIGCGHWGPNHVRVFSQLKDCVVVAVVDASDGRLAAMSENFPNIRRFNGHKAMLHETDLDVVIIATPTSTHKSMVEDALNAGKHVLCEKPLCIDPADGEMLVSLAKTKGLVLMVGHVFLFNSGIVKVKEIIDSGEIGSVRYINAVRTNLGPIRSDVNVAYDLASHDIAIFNWLLAVEPVEVQAMGRAFLQSSIEDVMSINMKYPGNVLASIQCSWLAPKKVRQITIVGSTRMITWDDMILSNPVAIYEKMVEMDKEVTDYGEFLRVSMVDGDVRLPEVQAEEPLKSQAIAFVRAIQGGYLDKSSGEFALTVVRVLEAIAHSIKTGRVICYEPHLSVSQI